MMINNTINNPMIPFETPTSGGFAPNSEVIIHGRSEKGKHGAFVVEFGAGNDVALHLSFRYKAEHKLVMNTSVNGSWQKEERHANPVFEEHSFVLQVQCKPGEFIIWQKHHKLEFKHRMDPMLINSLRINGEVSVESIKFERFGQGAGSSPYANAPDPSAPSPNQYPPGQGGPYGDSSYQPNIGGGTHQTPHIGGGSYGGPPPNIGGGTNYGMPSYGAQQNPSGIGFGSGFDAAPPPNIGYGATPAPNAGGYYPSLNDNTPTPNSGYPSMRPNPNQF